MTYTRRIGLGALLVLLLSSLVLGIDAWQRRNAPGGRQVAAGDIPVYQDGQLLASFSAADLQKLSQASFVDAEQGKPQEGWLLKDVLGLYAPIEDWTDTVRIVVSSSSRQKKIELSWAEVHHPANAVLLTLSGRGTLKLVSKLPQLDIRDEWIQDVDRMEILSR